MRVRHHLLFCCQGTTTICATIAWQYSGGAQGGERRCTSWREDPPKKPPTQIKTVCTNSLRKQFRDSLCKLSPFPFKISRKQTKEFAQTVCANCFYLGGWFFGWVAFPWVPSSGVSRECQSPGIRSAPLKMSEKRSLLEKGSCQKCQF